MHLLQHTIFWTYAVFPTYLFSPAIKIKSTMPHYFLKLIPRRPTFSQDMTPEERAIMMQHIAYWTELMDKGKVAVFGPVADPAGVYGMGVVEAENEEELINFMNNDPAAAINRYEYYLMPRAVKPKAL
jgi:uncharacterized protein